MNDFYNLPIDSKVAELKRLLTIIFDYIESDVIDNYEYYTITDSDDRVYLSNLCLDVNANEFTSLNGTDIRDELQRTSLIGVNYDLVFISIEYDEDELDDDIKLYELKDISEKDTTMEYTYNFLIEFISDYNLEITK